MKENPQNSLSYTQEGGDLLLVHAFNPLATSTQPLVAMMATMEGKGVDPEYNRRQAIDILKNPGDINQRVSLSTSLIKIDGKNTTWGHAGYILSVPRADVISTSKSDAGSLNSNLDRLIKLREENIKMGRILTPDELYEQSSEFSYNEVLVFAKNVRIVGCFVKISPDGKPLNKELATRVRQVAKDLSVECVDIKSNKEAETADHFKTPKVDWFLRKGLKDVLYVGFVDGEGIKFNIYISNTDNFVTKSTNTENWKFLYGNDKDLRQTSVEKTIEILNMALQSKSISDEQSIAITNAIKNCSKQNEVLNTATTLREGNAKEGCFNDGSINSDDRPR
jgi:hypothetical protein